MFEMCFYYNPRGGSRYYKWNNIDYTVGTAGVRRCMCASACGDFHYFCRGRQFPISNQMFFKEGKVLAPLEEKVFNHTRL